LFFISGFTHSLSRADGSGKCNYSVATWGMNWQLTENKPALQG